MQILVKNTAWSTLKNAIAVVAVSSELVKVQKRERKASKNIFSAIDAQLDGLLSKQLRDQQFKSKRGHSSILSPLNNAHVSTLLAYGWDDAKEHGTFEQLGAYRKLGVASIDLARRTQATEINVFTDEFGLRTDDQLLAFCEGLWLATYQFVDFKKKAESTYIGPKKVIIHSTKRLSSATIETASIYAAATKLARNLINLPPNHCTPSVLMRQAREIARKGKLSFKAFDRNALKKMGAGALLAVAQGSDEPPFLLKLVYKPRKLKSKKVITFVGKGVTFDSGGLSIKTGSGMETMKCDMSGAAAVLATMQAVAQLKPGFEVRGYVPTTENMINGSATRPGDVVRAMSGKTIEILNTDAEGRLILADALHLAQQDKCDVIVDLATLTGACMVALGTEYAGLFANNDLLAEKLKRAGEQAGERFWRMPLAPEYKSWIKSSVADIKNLGKPFGGAITAALFLEEFIDKVQWAHLDIAGPAFTDGDSGHIKKGGVGFGVRTLLNFLRTQ